MPIWRKDGAAPRRFDIALFERFSNHCLANLMEPLRAANTVLRRRAYEWRIVTLDDREVVSSSGLPVRPTASLSDGEGGDALFVLPSYGHRELATPRCLAVLRAAARRYDALGGLDTGSWLLAEAGLLDGRAATIHFDEFDAFAERFPEVDARRRRWIADGDRLTAGGATTAFELIREVISSAHGAAVGLEIAALFLAPGTSAHPPARAGGDRLVDGALARMAATVEAPLPVDAIAAELGCGPRELSRRFDRALGAPPGTVYRRIRLLAARRMVERGGAPVAEVATRCGYADASAFTRAFRREFGVAPRALR